MKNPYLILFTISLLSCTKQQESMSIFFTGDILLDRGIRQEIQMTGITWITGNSHEYFKNADFVFGNLECPATKIIEPVNKRFIFRAEPEWLKALSDAGFTHLTMANNHAYDQGSDGMKDTYKNIVKYKMIPVGYGEDFRKACDPVILKKGNIQVSIFSSVLLPLENWLPNDDSVNICQACVSTLSERISVFHKANPKVHIVVVLHWGQEFQKSPAIQQRFEAQTLINAGAEAIIGHHPHVVQDIVFYGKTPVFFSLGNFIFDQKTRGNKGLAVNLIITENSINAYSYPVDILNCRPFIKEGEELRRVKNFLSAQK